MRPDSFQDCILPNSEHKSHTILLFGILPDKDIDDIRKSTRGVLQNAADALQKSVISGLKENGFDFEVINLPFIGGWPNYYTKVFAPKSYTNVRDRIRFENLSFVNIRGYKMWSRYRNAYKALMRRVAAAGSRPVNILIYSITTPFIKAALKVKRRNKDVRVIILAPDLPEYMGGSTSGVSGYLHKYNNRILRKYYDRIDAYVVLTEQMTERLIFNRQPYTVVEGIYNPSDSHAKSDSRQEKQRILLYAGTLAERYGIIDLVDAAHSLSRSDFVLEIYGAGGAEDYVRIIAAIDRRIKFCGQIPRSEILKRQREAYLLINPRTANEEYTKYSFPSKTMEYLASGTPTLMHRLPGMPDEYEGYFIEIQGEGKNGIKKSLDSILNMNYKDAKLVGEKAREFILNCKNPKVQTQKIIKLLNSL